MRTIVALVAIAGVLGLFWRTRAPDRGAESALHSTLLAPSPSSSSLSKNADAPHSDPHPPSPHPMSGTTLRQMSVLNQILTSRNDNDPRLDTDLKVLDEETKEAFRTQYRALAPEAHNERGTIVFLLGRNLTSPRDIEFLKDVLSEPPCLGIKDCSRSTESAAGESDHQGNAVALVLAYPQLKALRAIQKLPLAQMPSALRDAAQAALRAARASRSPVVSQMAGPGG